MALITCPECGKQVSDKAKTCPGCGYPVKAKRKQKHDKELSNKGELQQINESRSKNNWWILIVVLGVVFVFAMFFGFLFRGAGEIWKQITTDVSSIDVTVEKSSENKSNSKTGETAQTKTEELDVENKEEQENDAEDPVPVSLHFYNEMYTDRTYVLDYTLKFVKDADGKPTKVELYKDNVRVDYIYQDFDDDGNCTQTFSYLLGSDRLYLTESLQVWGNGMLIGADGCMFHYIYDDLGRPSHREAFSAEASYDIEYFYNGSEDKPCRAIARYDGGMHTIYEYTYDDKGRLLCQQTDNYKKDGTLFIHRMETYEY